MQTFLGLLRDVGRYEGLAIYVGIPSLILAYEWDLRNLCPLTQWLNLKLCFSWVLLRTRGSLIWTRQGQLDVEENRLNKIVFRDISF